MEEILVLATLETREIFRFKKFALSDQRTTTTSRQVYAIISCMYSFPHYIIFWKSFPVLWDPIKYIQDRK